MTDRTPILESWTPDPDPPGAFARLFREPGAAFLDSALPMKGLGRWSFLCARPFLTVQVKAGAIRIVGEDGEEEVSDEDPFAVLRGLLDRFRLPHVPGGPPFQGGAVGFFAYDLGRRIERIPDTARDDLACPDLWLGFHDVAAAWDVERGEGVLVSTGLPEAGKARGTRARHRLEAFRALLRSGAEPAPSPFAGTGPLVSNFSREEYEHAVDRVRRYIVDGDIFQANLSQRFSAPIEGDPFDLYRTLRARNPAPFAAYVRAGALELVSSSPERFLLVEGDGVQTRPIKGTRPRGATKEEDRRLAEELLGSEKDRAENTMIVDLLRNDLGRVCRPGSVRVRELCALERFPTVFHLTSTVEGRLSEGRDRVDLLRAAFPGGSITGAPKVRAMEIIEELEPTRRGVYTGAIGYLGFSGTMDLNIVIRTILCAGGRAHYQVGGGIVYDSDPALEYEETLHKGRALADALAHRT